MSKMFTPWKMNNLNIPNRLVRSATVEGLGEADGKSTPQMGVLYKAMADNKVGMLITGMLYVNPKGKAGPTQVGIDNDSKLDGLKRLADTVHAGGSTIAAQIVHVGAQAPPELISENPFGPSAGPNPYTKADVQELTKDQIKNIIADFAAAAVRAKNAGFDAVQLHMAHAYLISQFLSPAINRRTDEYGGNAENRRRFGVEVYQAVRQAVGKNYPVFIKINALDEAIENGLVFEDSLAAMKALDALDIDAIEISGGVIGGNPHKSPARKVKTEEDEGYFFKYAQEAKKAVKCPVISVGGWRSYNRINDALNEIDAISLSRPLICQPNLVELWSKGEGLKSKCISCNKCFMYVLQGGVDCAFNHPEDKK